MAAYASALSPSAARSNGESEPLDGSEAGTSSSRPKVAPRTQTARSSPQRQNATNRSSPIETGPSGKSLRKGPQLRDQLGRTRSFVKQGAGHVAGIFNEVARAARVRNWLFSITGEDEYYTIEGIERNIYRNDERHHQERGYLLLEEKVIRQDNRVTNNKRPDEYLIRFVSDRTAKVVACLMLLSVLCTAAISPWTFMLGGRWSQPDKVPFGRGLLLVDLFSDTVYAVCLVLKLNMSFLHPQRRVEVIDRRQIRRMVLFSPSFIIHGISVTTYAWIIGLDAPLFINSIKIVRVSHLLRLPDALWKLKDEALVRIGRPILLLMVLSHWIACLLFYAGGYLENLEDYGVEEFTTTFQGMPVNGKVSLYFMAFVEALYMCTGSLDNPLGQGMQRENNFGSLLIVTIFGPVGCVIVALLIATFSREQNLSFSLENRHEESEAFVSRALENLDIPHQLRRRVYSLIAFERMSHDTEAFNELFKKSSLSRPLDDALKVYLYQDVLTSPFFKGTDINYMLEVLRVLEDRLFIPGDYMARRGEVGAEMLFINLGEIQIFVCGTDGDGNFSDDINDAVALPEKKGAGYYFGEISLLQQCPRTAWVLAETYVVASVLLRTSIETIWQYFPKQKEELIRVVADVRHRDAKRKVKHLWCRAVAKAMEGGGEISLASDIFASKPDISHVMQGGHRGARGASTATTHTLLSQRHSATSKAPRVTVRTDAEKAAAIAAAEEEAAGHEEAIVKTAIDRLKEPASEEPAGVESMFARVGRQNESLLARMNELFQRVEDMAAGQADLRAQVAKLAGGPSVVAPVSGDGVPAAEAEMRLHAEQLSDVPLLAPELEELSARSYIKVATDGEGLARNCASSACLNKKKSKKKIATSVPSSLCEDGLIEDGLIGTE